MSDRVAEASCGTFKIVIAIKVFAGDTSGVLAESGCYWISG